MYQSPMPEQKIADFQDPMTKMVCMGTALSKQHQTVELERKAYLESPIQRSEHGQFS